MTADDILRVRKCPSTPYAIAYWLWNNYDGCTEQLEDIYIKLLIDHDRVIMLKRIHAELHHLTNDEDYEEVYDAYVAKCAKIGYEPVPYVTYKYEMSKRKAEKVAHDKYLDDMTEAGAKVYRRIKLGDRYVTLPVEKYKLAEPLGKRIPPI
jgi:hypothetical protein